MLQFRRLYARISLTDRIQELPLVRSPADRTKVVTMAALLKFAGFETFKFFILSRLSSVFSAFRSWKSPTASGSTEHKALPAGSVVCLVHPPADWFFYWQEGHVFVLLGIVPASIWQMG